MNTPTLTLRDGLLVETYDVEPQPAGAAMLWVKLDDPWNTYAPECVRIAPDALRCVGEALIALADARPSEAGRVVKIVPIEPAALPPERTLT